MNVFWRSDHCYQWFYDGFLMLLPSRSMVFGGSRPLVKQCDGFNGSLWSTASGGASEEDERHLPGQDQERLASHPDTASQYGQRLGHAQHHQRHPLRPDLSGRYRKLQEGVRDEAKGSAFDQAVGEVMNSRIYKT